MAAPDPYLSNQPFLSSVVNTLYTGNSHEMGRSGLIALGFVIFLQMHPAEKTQHHP